jgi:DtxR family Mn-dependent transcriptional regulator
MYSISEENYIKAIFHLQKQGKAVSTNSLAASIQTKPASVTDMLKKLKNKSLLEYEPYHGVLLTPAGKKVALEVIRRHRLWEYFLVNTIGFDWDEVHEIAEELEHIQHPLLIEKLDEFLGKPAFDPHGDPIPDVNGKMEFRAVSNLNEIAPGKTVKFAGVGDQSSEFQRMLKHKAIKLGDRIRVVERFDFDQSIEIIINETASQSVSFLLAKMILVTIE